MNDYMIRATAAEGQIRAFAATTRDMVENAKNAHNTSGHHENVAKWRKKESYKRTMLRRPDLWAQFDEKQLKTKSEKKVLAEAKAEAEAIRAAEVKKAEESDAETPVE